MRYCYFLLVVVCSFFSCKDSPKKEAGAKQYPKAILDLTSKIDKNPTNAKLYFTRAGAYRQLGEDSLAFLDLLNTIKYDSTKAHYFSAIGDFLFDKKDISGSVKWFSKAISINPADETSHLKMANLFMYTEEYQKAFAEINTVLRQNVYNAEAYFLKGLCYKGMGNMDKAISSFQTAVQTEPRYYDGFMQLGLLYSQRKDSIALKYFDNAIRLDSFNFEGHYNKAMFYQTQEQFAEAKKVFKKALQVDKHYAEAHYNIGWMLLQQDSIDKAKREFERVIVLVPDNPRAYYNRGLCNEILEDYTAAQEDYEQALVFDPNFDLPTTALERVKKKL